MKQLVSITFAIIALAVVSVCLAETPATKRWYDNAITTTLPDDAKFLIHDPNLPALNSDRTVSEATVRNTVLRQSTTAAAVFYNNSGQMVGCITKGGAMIIGSVCELAPEPPPAP